MFRNAMELAGARAQAGEDRDEDRETAGASSPPAHLECLAKGFKAGEQWDPSHPEKAHPVCSVQEAEGWVEGELGSREMRHGVT